MIYINKNSSSIIIPRHTFENGTQYYLIASSNLSNDVVLVNKGNNVSTNSLYYEFALSNLSKLSAAEYEYTLYTTTNNVKNILERGLLTFGQYNREVTVNNTFNPVKKQYNG